MGNFFAAIGTAIYNFITNPVVQAVLFVAQGVTAHQAAMKAKRTGADILLQKYGTGGGIPVIYGTRRVAGTVVYMETQNNRELYVVYAIAAHELDSFDLESIQLDGRTIKDTNIYRQGYDISDGTTRIQFRPSGGTTTRASGTFWGNTSTERANITGGANINNKARMTFNCHKGTTTQAADPMLEGILTDWTSSHKLTGIAYIAANYEYDTQGMFSGIPNLTIVVNGKKVFDPRDTNQTFGTESTYTHSSNAALCLLDYITNDDYGKGLGTSDLESDFASWKTAADDCDTSVDTIDHTAISVESASTDSDVMIIADASQAKFNKLKIGSKYTVDDGTTTYVNNKKLIDKDSTQIDIDGSNAFAILKLKFEDGAIDNAITSATSCDFAETQIRFDCNGVLDTEETVLENTKLLIANMRGIFTYANGKYQVKVEGAESSVVTLDEDDILESGITLSLENKEAKYNKVEAEFYNAQKRYESDTTYYTGETSDTFLADDGNEVLETRIQLPFCTNQRIAYNHAKGLLKRSRKQKTISFVATPKVLKAKVGEVITVSNTNLNLSSELYRITNMTINPDLNVAVTAIEYQTDVYGYATPPDEDIDIPDDPPEGNRVVAPTNLTFTNKNATTGEAAKLTWTDSTKYPSYEFRVRIIDGLKTRYDKRVKDTYFYLDGISVANGYTAKVSAINALGVESDSTDITVNVTTEPVTTPDIKDGSITADKILANTITANEIASGTITATELDANSVTADKINVTDLAAISADLGSITAGSLNINSGQFVVTSAGAMTAQSATITGSVTSSSGTIGGFTLGSNFLTAGSATSRIKLSTADGIHMGNDTFALAPFNVTKSGQVTATDLILKKGNVTYFDSTDGFSAEAIAQIASSLNTRVQTFAFSSENNTDYATIETTEDSQDIKLVVRANASSLQGSGTSEALAIAEIPDNLTIKIEFDDNTGFTSPTTIGSLQTYNASTDSTPLASEYEIETLDLSELGGDFSAFVLGNQGAVNTSGDIVYTVSSYTVATAGTYYFRVIYDTTDTTYDATNDPENFTRSLEIEDLSGSGFLISDGSSGAQTSDAVTLTGTQTISGAKTFSATTTFSGDVNISGDLSVTGTTTTIDTATLNVEDKNITLNYSTGDSSSTADGAGITIQDAVNSTTDATITWDATNDEFDFSHGITLPDSKKIQLGASNDLQIYHDGTHSYIKDAGTGNLYIRGDNTIDLRRYANGEQYLTAVANGAVTLFYDGASKLATTSTGISVTGTVTATSFSGDGSGLTGITSTTINNNADNRVITGSNTANTLNGEANLTFDGSNLGIGASSLTHPLTVSANPSNGQLVKFKRTSVSGAWLELENNDGGFGIGTDGGEFNIYDRGDLAYRFTIDTSGHFDFYSGNLTNIGTISSGSITTSGDLISSDGDINHYINTSTRIFKVDSTGIDIKAGGLKIGNTLVADMSRNLTNIGTISAAAITTSAANQDINMDASANGQLQIDGNGYKGAIALGSTTMAIYNNSGSRSLTLGTNETARIIIGAGGGVNFNNNNLTSVGTIDSGAITSTGIIRSSSTNPQLRIHTSSGTGTGYLVFGDSVDDDIGQIRYNHSNDSMQFVVNTATALTLDSSQNATFAGTLAVGGTSTNSSYGVYLQNNKWYATQYSSLHDVVRMNANTAGGLDIYNQTDGGFANTRVGSLNISSTTVIDSSRNLTNIASINVDGGAKSVFTNTSSSLIDLSGGTSGALQIGTSSSTVVATIAGRQTNTTQSGLGFYSATADGNTSAVGDMHFNVRENNNSTFATLTKKAFVWTHYLSELMHLTRGGNLSVAGTISSGDITVSSSSPLITLTDSDNSLSARINGANGNLYLNSHNVNRDVFIGEQAGGATNMTILGDGNVGIGSSAVSAPAQLLHVAGTGSNVQFGSSGVVTPLIHYGMPTFYGVNSSDDVQNFSFRYGNANSYAFNMHQRVTSGVVRWSLGQKNANVDYNDVLVFHNGKLAVKQQNATQTLDVAGNIGISGTEFITTARNLINIVDITTSGNIDMTGAGDTSDKRLHLPRAGFITFYGNNATNHSICSRDGNGNVNDDIRINSYGGVIINLDTNNNNSSSADFSIGKHGGGTGAVSPFLFLVNGENGDTTCTGNITAYGSISDIRRKKNIKTIENPLDKVAQLRGITFDYKKDGKRSTGLIAQELEKVLPEAVYETSDIDNKDDKFKAVRYGNVVGLLVEAIKELKAEIEELKKA